MIAHCRALRDQFANAAKEPINLPMLIVNLRAFRLNSESWLISRHRKIKNANCNNFNASLWGARLGNRCSGSGK